MMSLEFLVHAITQTFLDAVNSCPAISIKFQATNREKQAVMNGFLGKREGNGLVV
jgi:hypothetical protein